MQVRLLDPENDNDPELTMPPELRDITEADLELATVYTAMAAGDGHLRDVARKVITSSLTDPYTIGYRQDVLSDCMTHEPIVRELHRLAIDAGQAQRKVYLGGLLTRDPNAILRRAVALLNLLIANLEQLRAMCDSHFQEFESTGFKQFWAMIADQLDDDYLAVLHGELGELALPQGVLFSGQLGQGNKGTGYRLHRAVKHRWWEKLTGGDHSRLAFSIDDRDQAGSEALTELTGRAVNDVANILSQAVDHIQGFFERLRHELAFYLGCINLRHVLDRLGVPIAFPDPAPPTPRRFHCKDLRDIALCLTTDKPVTGNTLSADDATLIVVTGANEGGKSTFLRSLGSAQMMMQAGMFVTAESLTASVTNGVYTHFKREEDASMAHGKLDEELARMSLIANAISPHCLLLCNESFASTNEREGAQIARGIIDTFTGAQIAVAFVTHLYDLGRSLSDRHDPGHLFLRAERLDDATRTHKLTVGEPQPTSYGLDSFVRVFGQPAGTAHAP